MSLQEAIQREKNLKLKLLRVSEELMTVQQCQKMNLQVISYLYCNEMAI